MWCDLVAMMMAFYLRHGQSHAAAELSMRGSGGSSAVPVTMCQLRGWTRLEGAGFSDSEGALCPLSSLECPRFQGDGLDLLGGILKSILELGYKG